MPRQTDKEKCFQAAVDELQEYQKRQGREPPQIDHQQQWTRGLDGNWAPTNINWAHIMNSIQKTLRLLELTLLGGPPVEPTRPHQVRYPDVTVTGADGRKVVVDTKFDRPSGGTDDWGTKPGTGGKDQKTDYDDINKQQQQDGKDRGLTLDPQTCKCSGDPQPVYELKPQPMPASQFYLSPTAVPGVGPTTLPSLPTIPTWTPAPPALPVF